MGIYSQYIHSNTPQVTVDFSKLPADTLDFLCCRSGDDVDYNTETAGMTIDSLGQEFSDSARIWGYLSGKMLTQLHGMLDGLSGTAEMVFACDDDWVRYYTIRFDKLKNTVEFFKPKDLKFNEMTADDFLAHLSQISWVQVQVQAPV